MHCHSILTSASPSQPTWKYHPFGVQLRDVFTIHSIMRLSSTGNFLFSLSNCYLFSSLPLSIWCIYYPIYIPFVNPHCIFSPWIFYSITAFSLPLKTAISVEPFRNSLSLKDKKKELGNDFHFLAYLMRKKRLELSQDIKNTVRKGRSAHHLSLGNQKGNQNTLRGIYILLSNYKYTYLKMCSSLTPLLIFCCPNILPNSLPNYMYFG